jgi:hypothetical protein
VIIVVIDVGVDRFTLLQKLSDCQIALLIGISESKVLFGFPRLPQSEPSYGYLDLSN